MKYARILAAIAALTLLPVLAGNAMADYCIAFTTFPGDFYVGRSFSLPGKGKCKAFIGFAIVGHGNSPFSGTGCVATDGSNFGLSGIYTEPDDGGSTFLVSGVLSLPSQTGSVFENESSAFPVTGGKCSPPKPVPAVKQAAPPGGPGTR
jgi:hypothetical protein